MTPTTEKNGYMKWWQGIAALVVAALAVLSFLVAQERSVVHLEQYRVDQHDLGARLDRMDAKLDAILLRGSGKK